MPAPIVVPWYPLDPQRVAVWEWLTTRWEAMFPGWPIVESRPRVGAFNCAQAVNWAVDVMSDNVTTVIVAYADIAVDPLWVADAIDRVEAGDCDVAVPARCHHVDRWATADLLRSDPADRRYTAGFPSGEVVTGRWPGLCVARRGSLLMDERFDGWGYEGDAFLAVHAAGGRVWDAEGDCWHLWHHPRREGTWRSYGAERRRWLYAEYCRASAAGELDTLADLVARSRPGGCDEYGRRHPRSRG